MYPILFSFPFAGGTFALSSYALFVGLAFLAAYLMRRREVKRLGYQKNPAQRWVGLGALLGAVVGAKLGMILFTHPADMQALLALMLDLDFTGKTVVGGIAGGYIGVEISKKLVGITHSTGDGWAVAIPLGQGIGRIGCFLNGCCYGKPTDSPYGVVLEGVLRHPTQLYEAVLDLSLAGLLFSMRTSPRPEGHLFRRFLVGYALIRFFLEFLRGDTGLTLGPLTGVQWVCGVAALVFGGLIVRGERGLKASTP